MAVVRSKQKAYAWLGVDGSLEFAWTAESAYARGSATVTVIGPGSEAKQVSSAMGLDASGWDAFVEGRGKVPKPKAPAPDAEPKPEANPVPAAEPKAAVSAAPEAKPKKQAKK